MWLAPPLPRTLEAALRDLAEPSAQVRASAVDDLGNYVDSPARADAILGLLRALTDASPIVRAKAARSLGDAKATTAVPRLLTAVEDDDALVRQLSLEALGNIGDAAATARVRRALSDPRPEVRFQSVLAFAKLAPDEAMSALATAADDTDAGIRYIALRSAEEAIQGSATIFSLAPKSPLPPEFEAIALSRLTDSAPEVRVAAALLLASNGNRAGESLLLDVAFGRKETPEREDEAAAVEAIGALGLTAAIPALERRAYGVTRIIRDRCSFHAKVSLARLGVARAKADILKDLESWSRERRNHAVLAAGRAGLREAKSLLQSMRRSPDRADPTAVDEALASIALTEEL